MKLKQQQWKMLSRLRNGLLNHPDLQLFHELEKQFVHILWYDFKLFGGKNETKKTISTRNITQ